MMTPTAEMKPAINGSDRKRIRKPRRPMPSTRWTPPTSNAKVAAYETYSGDPAGASLANATAPMIEMVASGPTLS